MILGVTDNEGGMSVINGAIMGTSSSSSSAQSILSFGTAINAFGVRTFCDVAAERLLKAGEV